MPDLLEIAQQYLNNGLSILPVKPGTKHAKGQWKQFQTRHPTKTELEKWFSNVHVGLCVVAGEISGTTDPDGTLCGLEILDCDDTDTLDAFLSGAQELGLDHILERMPTERTPGGGQHWGWYCSQWESSLKLAQKLIREKPVRHVETLMETRGEGGQCLIAPTPAGIHPEHPERSYELISGSWLEIPIITPDERERILSLARSFNSYLPPGRERMASNLRQGPLIQGDRPGDHLNQSADHEWWATLLTRHGWVWLYQHSDTHYWQRPGKSERDKGVSATWGRTGNSLYVFSTAAAPFEHERAYTPFAALTLLDHAGDFKACARSLAPTRPARVQPHMYKPSSDPGYRDEQIDSMLHDVVMADEEEHGRLRLDLTEKGKVQECLLNYVTIFLEHRHWAGRLSYNSFARRQECDRIPLTPEKRIAMGVWAAEQFGLKGSYHRMREDAILHVCCQSTYDPLKEYVESLPLWDGIDRLGHWLADWCGSPETDYEAWVGKIMIVQMIARALMPGCIARYVVVLEGEEERGKSQLVRELGHPWSIVFDMSMDQKEAHMAVQGAWVAELAELDTLRRTTETRLKSFIAQTHDSFVPKYSNDREDIPRRCVFIGTTNEDQYLVGETGNTRFLPVKTDTFQLDVIRQYREQLFAEAKAFLLEHLTDWWEPPEFVRDRLHESRSERRVVNVFEDSLARWLDGYDDDGMAINRSSVDETTWHEIARDYLKLERKDWKDKGLQMQIGSALRALGWKRTLKRNGKERKWLWERS